MKRCEGETAEVEDVNRYEKASSSVMSSSSSLITTQGADICPARCGGSYEDGCDSRRIGIAIAQGVCCSVAVALKEEKSTASNPWVEEGFVNSALKFGHESECLNTVV